MFGGHLWILLVYAMHSIAHFRAEHFLSNKICRLSRRAMAEAISGIMIWFWPDFKPLTVELPIEMNLVSQTCFRMQKERMHLQVRLVEFQHALWEPLVAHIKPDLASPALLPYNVGVELPCYLVLFDCLYCLLRTYPSRYLSESSLRRRHPQNRHASSACGSGVVESLSEVVDFRFLGPPC